MSEDDHDLGVLLISKEVERRRKPVLPDEYDSDIEEILSQIRNLQTRLAVLERKMN